MKTDLRNFLALDQGSRVHLLETLSSKELWEFFHECLANVDRTNRCAAEIAAVIHLRIDKGDPR